MKTKSLLFKISKTALRISLLVLIIIQVSVLTAHAAKTVKLRWGTTLTFDGTGGGVTPDGKTAVANGGTVSYGNNDNGVTFTITPESGYVISRVERKEGTENFTIGDGNSLTPVNNKVSFDMDNKNWVLQVTFTLVTAHNVYVRWGTNTDWNGDRGTVTSTGYTVSNKSNTSFGGTATPVFILTPDSGYYVSSVKWRDNDANGFDQYDSGTNLTVTNNQVSFQMTNRDCSLQVIFAPIPTVNVYTRWRINTEDSGNTWTGNGGLITATGKTVQNNYNVNPDYAETATVTFTITPNTGYVIDTVQWKDNDSNGFTSNQTVLSPDASGVVSFTLVGNTSSFQVVFKLDPNAAHDKFISYYGTGAIDITASTTPDWVGGVTSRFNGSSWDTIGTSSYTTTTYPNDGNKRVKITPTTSPAYTITAVMYCEASWTDPRVITVTAGTCVTRSADGNGEIIVPAASPNNYIVFVQFGLVGAVGGNIGAWYGTNNTLDYDASTATPPGANGSGGTVWRTDITPSVSLPNRTASGSFLTTNKTVTIQVRPATDFKITAIQYGISTPTTSVPLPADPTTNATFTFDVSGGNSYKIWVVFASTATLSHTVTGSIDSTTSANCTSTSITPASQLINNNNTATFTFSTSSNCVVESVQFCPVGVCQVAVAQSSTTYTTPAITSSSSVVVKFAEVGYNIQSANHANNPSGCGTIDPIGSNNVPRGGTKTFTFNPSATCTVTHVFVTDPNRGYVDKDIAPLASPTYTFSDVRAAGAITVQYSAIAPTSSDSYCQIPAFVAGQASLAPNVLIIFDNSGSMGGNDSDGFAYNLKDKDGHALKSYVSSTTYYGYFDPKKMYKISTGDANKYEINSIDLDLSSNLSGNKLNFTYMHKVDIVRKVLMGGKVVSRTSSPYYLSTDAGQTVEYGTTLPTGLIQRLAGKVRFGLMVFNEPADGGHLATIPVSTADPHGKAVLGTTEAGLINAIEGTQTDPKTNTPMAETLYEAIRYFQAKKSAYNTGVDYGGILDPVQNSCQKHFILLLTDGEPNNTDKLPGTANSYTDSIFNAATWEDRILADDRASNNNSTCLTPSTNAYICPTPTEPLKACTTNTQLVESVAYYMHNTDLRSSVYGNPVDPTETVVQNITLFPVYAFGNGSGKKTLQMAAKYGGYDNNDGNAPSPNTYPSPKTPDNPTSGSPEWNKAGTCVPYNYFEADSGTVLENQLNTAMSTILAKVASGTAASILSNSEGSGANLLQAVFYPNKIFPAPNPATDSTSEVSWTGEMQNLWYYVDPFLSNSTVREDTDFSTTTPNHIMNLKNDYVTHFYFANAETKVELKQDTDGDGLGNDPPIALAIDPDNVKSLWRAGRQLWARDPELAANPRKIHTSVDGYSLLHSVAGVYPATDKYGGFYAPSATSDRVTQLQPYLQVSSTDSNAEAMKVIAYIRGTDQTGYRNRRVSLSVNGTTVTNAWKLGDIVSSTPKLQSTNKLNTYNLVAPSGYNDKSYGAFINSSNYLNRGMVYVGANDGMLHAFKLGKLTVATGADTGIVSGTSTVKIGGFVKASLTGTDLGEEQWAYIPRSNLPYLKYFTDAINYKHINYMDGPTVLADISVVKTGSCSTDYSLCAKDLTGGTNWATVLIGSMGLGGATRLPTNSCSVAADGRCVKTPIYDPDDTAAPKTKGVGYSSYFALDITNQYFSSDVLANQPVLKWEFPPRDAADNFGLGYATSGAAIIRIAAKLPADSNGVVKPDTSKNGKWFAVFASGPTGPIDSSVHRFMGRSDQNLKLFVVDLGATVTKESPFVPGTNYWVIDTGITEAFGGSVVNGSVDTDRWNGGLDGNYQDDALYVGYTKKRTDSLGEVSWTDGGVGRLLTKESTNPSEWVFSKVIDGIGPVTTGISRLQDRKNQKLWLYFGTGRFFYTGDDSANAVNNQRYIMGVQEPCYTTANKINPACSVNQMTLANLKNQTTIDPAALSSSEKGWYVALDPKYDADSLGAERSITDSVAMSNGAVFFTTFKPTTDVCKFGGYSYVWGFNYATGGAASANALTGKVLVQVSTGAFEEVSLSSALKASGGRKMDTPMIGKPPTDAPPVISSSNNPPAKKILHIQEK